MTREEQIQFVKSMGEILVNSIIKDIEANKVPEDFNGLELKWLLESRMKALANYRDPKSRRARFNNAVLVNDL